MTETLVSPLHELPAYSLLCLCAEEPSLSGTSFPHHFVSFATHTEEKKKAYFSSFFYKLVVLPRWIPFLYASFSFITIKYLNMCLLSTAVSCEHRTTTQSKKKATACIFVRIQTKVARHNISMSHH